MWAAWLAVCGLLKAGSTMCHICRHAVPAGAVGFRLGAAEGAVRRAPGPAGVVTLKLIPRVVCEPRCGACKGSAGAAAHTRTTAVGRQKGCWSRQDTVGQLHLPSPARTRYVGDCRRQWVSPCRGRCEPQVAVGRDALITGQRPRRACAAQDKVRCAAQTDFVRAGHVAVNATNGLCTRMELGREGSPLCSGSPSRCRMVSTRC